MTLRPIDFKTAVITVTPRKRPIDESSEPEERSRWFNVWTFLLGAGVALSILAIVVFLIVLVQRTKKSYTRLPGDSIKE